MGTSSTLAMARSAALLSEGEEMICKDVTELRQLKSSSHSGKSFDSPATFTTRTIWLVVPSSPALQLKAKGRISSG